MAAIHGKIVYTRNNTTKSPNKLFKCKEYDVMVYTAHAHADQTVFEHVVCMYF